ncbi:hypothetical protein U1Q18_013340 [Sarracenia purpurea var. burkii]
MGQGLSCGEPHEDSLFSAVQNGELETLETMADEDPTVFQRTTVRGRFSPLHIAASNGQIQVLSMLLDCDVNPDILNRYKQVGLDTIDVGCNAREDFLRGKAHPSRG